MKLDSLITIGRDEMNKKQWDKLLRRLTFFDTEENEISAFQYVSSRNEVYMPRGALDMLPAKLDVSDLRSMPPMPKVAYMRELDAPGYDGQIKAVEAMFEKQQGQVIAPPGRGKTEMCLAFAASCKTRVLVVVHTHDLLKQWQDRATLVVPGMPQGKIQGSTCQVEHLTIATAQTLKRHINDGGKFWRQFGAVIVDETHHAAAETWEWILNVCPAFYRFGVSASQKRSDGREALVRFNVGPVIYKLKFKSAVPITVYPWLTEFKSKYNGMQYTRVVRELVNDEDRNSMIAKRAVHHVKNGHSVLVLSRQIKHLELIHDHIGLEFGFDEGSMQGVQVVTGQLAKKKRDHLIESLRDGSIRCILGTQLFEEGVDIPRLNRIVLAYPGTELTALQKVGRGSRAFDGKTSTIVDDYLDQYVHVLAKQYLRRRTWYRSVGIKVRKPRRYQHGTEDKVGTQAQGKRRFRRGYQVARPHRT